MRNAAEIFMGKRIELELSKALGLISDYKIKPRADNFTFNEKKMRFDYDLILDIDITKIGTSQEIKVDINLKTDET